MLLPVLGIMAWLAPMPIGPEDFWWHLRTGQIIAQTGQIPSTDLFTSSRAGLPWTNQAWLAQLAFYLLYRAGGLPFLGFFNAVIISAGYALVEMACLQDRRVRAKVASVATLAAGLLGVANWPLRPQTFSFLLFGTLVWVLEAHRLRRTRALWALPFLFAFWANLHGGFVFGIALLGIYVLAALAQDLIRERHLARATYQLLGAGLLSGLALGLNPDGPLGLLRYVIGFAQSPTTLNANLEFLPLNIREQDGLIFFLLMALFVALAYRRRVAFPLYMVLSLALFGFLSLYTRRMLPWFGMIAGPAFSIVLLSPKAPVAEAPRRQTTRRGINYAILALLLLNVAFALPWLRPHLPSPPLPSYSVTIRTPVRATQQLCRQGTGRAVYSDLGYSSYLEWACPALPIFMDSRFELYPTDMWQDYISIANAVSGWETKLAKYGIDVLFLPRTSKTPMASLVTAAKSSPAWRVLYEDADTVIFMQQGP